MEITDFTQAGSERGRDLLLVNSDGRKWHGRREANGTIIATWFRPCRRVVENPERENAGELGCNSGERSCEMQVMTYSGKEDNHWTADNTCVCKTRS